MSDRYQQVGAVFSGTLRSEGTQLSAAPLPIRRRKASLTRVLVSRSLMALVLVAGWFVGLRPYLHELVQKEIDGVLSNAVDQIDRVPISNVSPQSRAQARQAIFEYLEAFYHRQRLHSSLGYVSPVTYEQQAK